MESINFFQKINKIVLVLIWLGAAGTSGGLLFDYLNGTRTLLEFLMIFFVTFGAAIGSSVAYKKNPNSKIIRTLCMGAFIFYYGFLYITYPSFLPFIFIFPILTLETLYASKKGAIIDGVVVVGINIVGTYLRLRGQDITVEIISQLIMQFGTIFAFITIITLVVWIYANSINKVDISVKQAIDAQLAQKNILEDILKLIEVSNGNSKEVYDIVQETSVSSQKIVGDISKMAQSMNQTTENLQSQQVLIDRIQQKISDTLKSYQEMEQTFLESESIVYDSSNNSEALNDKSKDVRRNYNSVYEGMQSLKGKTREISDIVEIIGNLAEQTNLVALNASIEAARAGESGRGFAVVAEEVRKLADESRSATDNITLIIEDITYEMNKNVSSIEDLNNLNNEQDNLIANNRESLLVINSSVKKIEERMKSLNGELTYIFDAAEEINKAIVDTAFASKETIDKFQETIAISEEHIENSNNAKKMVEELISVSNTMNKYSC